ncbi:hypothetical protein JANAI62_05260 [Jannaschia pagri]|uniref:Aspartate/glutamate racemase family protein n=1 Tax=Jannaschia pagri TaxID=2829797 RepID=A0ABQ4NHJ5_9RHOB|nr:MULTISPECIES: aspartate/glutamate racemase family protein [unclassified Jannaschia]GIT89991.1 hypothetical protein JANAI61_04490 [Jannaschia sp. AI_61]GIT93903.1 hypothetical protein JANAI62_05260 [Jannaschia sp. AI_62]
MTTGPHIGVLMLDTAFPRILGDAGNVDSYPCPAVLHRVAGAEARRVVRPGQPDVDLLPPFLAAARTLEEGGAVGLVSTCGFLVHFQGDIARAVGIPVILSALSLCPLVQGMTGGRPVGILTASAASLTQGGLAAAGIAPQDAHVAGLEDCPAFALAILSPDPTPLEQFDSQAIAAAAVARARALIDHTPEIGAILLECGNLPPYTQAIAQATGRPVFSILDAARLLWRDGI